MTFLNLGALFGMAAVSIPIIIHLLNQFQVKEVKWAAMRFLRESIDKNQRRLQIEDLILLVLRCLLIALLILVLSRPTWQSGASAFGSHQATAVIIIDDSYSMGLTNGIETSLQRAQKAAEQVVDAFPTGSSSSLFFAADNVQQAIAQPTYDLNLLRQTIKQAKLTDRSTDMSTALQQAVATLQKHEGGGSKEIYLITDGQANGWPSLDQLKKQLTEIEQQISVHIVLVGDTAESNLAVTDLRLDGALAAVNQPLRCSVQVLNCSDTEARDVRVSLSVDDEPAVDETIIESIPPGTRRDVALFAKLRKEGYHSITAQIPHDRLPADDQRTLAVRAIRSVNVLLVEGNAGTRPSEADDFFVRNALVPVPADDVSQYFVKTKTVGASQLSGTSLDDYDAVFLLGVDQFDPTEVPTLVNYVRQGGGLVIFPGPDCNIGFYNEDLGRDGFLPARLAAFMGDTNPNHEGKYLTLQPSDYDNPITTLWNDPSAGTLATARFYAYYPLTLTPWKTPGPSEPTPTAGQPRVIFNYAQGDSPAAVEHTWGSGRVVLFGSTPTIEWNDLPIHQAFVPLIQRVLGSLIARQDEGLNVRVGQQFSYTVNNDLLNKDVSISAPGQTEPPRVVGQVTLINSLPTVQFDDTDEAGAYKVSIATDPPYTLQFAAQSDPNESNLTPLSADQLKSLSQVTDVIPWNSGLKGNLTPKLTQARLGTELWLPLLIAALVIATVETFLAQKFSQSK
ncbi:MAG: BatA domain-containing protein [Methylacidiphilales bacterium]|nr:BatA domain-containing protein [Candidatus Methylacidiphilales bacterium]